LLFSLLKSLGVFDYTCFFEMFTHNLFDLGAFLLYRPVSRDKNNIPSPRTQGCGFAVCFLYNPFAAVSLHRAAEFFAGCYAYTANSRAVFQYISNQRGICLWSASPVDSAKITVLLKCCYSCQSNQSVRLRVLKINAPVVRQKALFCPSLCAGQELYGRFCLPFFCENHAPYFYGAFLAGMSVSCV
jgi:hypothetical protein